MLNSKEKDDLPPYKLVEIPISSGEFTGEKISNEEWETMLDEYYKCHHRDIKTGLQTRNCLEKLGLDEVK